MDLCPQCGRPTTMAPENPWRPFCSQRCRTIDLGAWVDERYRVPSHEPADPGSGLADTQGDSDREG